MSEVIELFIVSIFNELLRAFRVLKLFGSFSSFEAF
jgi:hypothetical protein